MQWFGDFISMVLGTLLAVLPDSPFEPLIAQIAKLDYLPFINWFVPVGTILGIGTTWLTCIGIYYLYQVILRWAKVIGD